MLEGVRSKDDDGDGDGVDDDDDVVDGVVVCVLLST